MRGHGVEIWNMRGGKLVQWDLAINMAEVGQDDAVGLA